MSDVPELEKFRKRWKQELSKKCDREDTDNDIIGHNCVTETKLVSAKLSNDSSCSPLLAPHRGRTVSKEPEETPSCSDQPSTHPAFRDEMSYTCKILSNNPSDKNSSYYPFAIVGNLLNSTNESPSGKVPHNSRQKDREEVSVTAKFKRTFQPTSMTSDSKSAKKYKLEHIFAPIRSDSENVQPENFLDKFIDDLNEINEIPFFDISIPKEVAVKIFQNLDVQDLCNCAKVSKSWKYIAEDELLWYRIYHKLGYPTDKSALEETRWKAIVKERIERKNAVIRNWKGRIGRLTSLEHFPGGILCAVDSSEHHVVAGYSSGVVKLWNLATDQEWLFQPSSTSLQLDMHAEEGTTSNCVAIVQISATTVAASYTHGNVDVWSINKGSEPAQTIQCKRPPISRLCMDSTGRHMAIASGPFIQTFSNRGTCFDDVGTIDMPKCVKHMKMLEDRHKNLLLAISTEYVVTLNAIGFPMDHMTEIHNMIGAPVTCVECRTEPNQMAVGLEGCIYGGTNEGYKVNIYDLNTAKHLMVLHGHTWIVSCMNLAESPPNYLVTGSGDRKVRLFDLRVDVPVQTFSGHSHKVSTVQMDEWKVVSGGEDGFVYVWDRRMTVKLWEWHNRHPVRHCRFIDKSLTVGNVPFTRFPVLDEFETATHRRFRGSVQVYDFLSNQTTEGLPDICLSTYDEPKAYNYSIRLAMPYDSF
ncbi:hypothetical protein ScPMuIL_005710 [Solemya velum]